jgi:hypothetical protein
MEPSYTHVRASSLGLTGQRRGLRQVMSRTWQSFIVLVHPRGVFVLELQRSNTVSGFSHASRSAVEFALRQRVGPVTHTPGFVEQLTSALASAREHTVQLSVQRKHQSTGCAGSACNPPAEPNSEMRTRPIWSRCSLMRAMVLIPVLLVAVRYPLALII